MNSIDQITGIGQIETALKLLLGTRTVAELRIPNTRRATLSGYFDDFDKLAQTAAGLSGKAPGLFITLNPINPDLLSRSANHLTPFAKHTTSDSDILRRHWLT